MPMQPPLWRGPRQPRSRVAGVAPLLSSEYQVGTPFPLTPGCNSICHSFKHLMHVCKTPPIDNEIRHPIFTKNFCFWNFEARRNRAATLVHMPARRWRVPHTSFCRLRGEVDFEILEQVSTSPPRCAPPGPPHTPRMSRLCRAAEIPTRSPVAAAEA